MERNKAIEPFLAPVFGRAWCAKKYGGPFEDPLARQVVEQSGYPFEYLDIRESQAVTWSVGQWIFCRQIRKYLEERPEAVIVDAGCGLDTLFPLVDNGRCRWVNLDLPDALELREQFLPCGERERNLPANVLRTEWTEQIREEAERGFYLVASNVMGLITQEHVKELFMTLEKQFPGGGLFFDCKTSRGSRRSRRMSGLWKGGERTVFPIDDAAKLFKSWGFSPGEFQEMVYMPPFFWEMEEIPRAIRTRLRMNWTSGVLKHIEVRF